MSRAKSDKTWCPQHLQAILLDYCKEFEVFSASLIISVHTHLILYLPSNDIPRAVTEFSRTILLFHFKGVTLILIKTFSLDWAVDTMLRLDPQPVWASIKNTHEFLFVFSNIDFGEYLNVMKIFQVLSDYFGISSWYERGININHIWKMPFKNRFL